MVIVGRPYNSCDSAVNLEIPKKLGTWECLPSRWTTFRWNRSPRSGAAEDWIRRSTGGTAEDPGRSEIIKDDPSSTESTSPTSAAARFLYRSFLQGPLEKQALSPAGDRRAQRDAVRLPRCEAFLDSLKNGRPEKSAPVKKEKARADKTRKSISPTCATTPLPWPPLSGMRGGCHRHSRFR